LLGQVRLVGITRGHAIPDIPSISTSQGLYLYLHIQDTYHQGFSTIGRRKYQNLICIVNPGHRHASCAQP
jgi:hypothetical protein